MGVEQIMGKRSLEKDILEKSQSFRSKVITKRTYNRPLNTEGTIFETWEETIDRVIEHQKWLWERVLGSSLSVEQIDELYELKLLILNRMTSLSGRTLWLGGTNISKTCEASQFNCSGTVVETVYDVVDTIWLLMQGCGVGFKAITGQLTGFRKPIEVEVIRSTRKDKGNPDNVEFIRGEVWTIRVGDSAKAWAKFFGKLVIGKYIVSKLVIDLSEIRPAGTRLKGYGWICSGDENIAIASKAICEILNKRADKLLSKIDILDLENWLGTILSSRRSAEIALQDYGTSEWVEFVTAKKDYWLKGNDHRSQSNNSLLFWSRPRREELVHIFNMMMDSGGSDPGFVNAEEATRRAPWFSTLNPCAEILLPNKGFCNLVEINIAAFSNDLDLDRAVYIMARANYRQTCVSLSDGILQESWDANNKFLRLCGVGLTGIAQREEMTPGHLGSLRSMAVYGANSMADELNTPRSKNVTTIKPSGTLSKVMDCSEGLHTPLGKYIFNWIKFSIHDPLVEKLKGANYDWLDNVADSETVVIKLPVKYEGCKFTDVCGTELNLETAIDQLERYALYQIHWTDQNTSVTISYDQTEVPGIIDWLLANWNVYVGVSFIYRNDPSKTAKDLGHKYLPQEVVTKEAYEEYVKTLKDVDIDSADSYEEIQEEGCVTGMCPVK